MKETTSSPDISSNKQGVLLLNLGSPDSTEVADVRRYLREFLSDERVIDIPAPIRKLILNLFILPFRPRQSAEAYEEIWTDEGSPLIVMTYRCAELLQERMKMPVEVGMRYGNPSTKSALQRLVARGVKELLVIPLYPHYAMSSYETAVARVQADLKEVAPDMKLTIEPPYYEDPDYIDALYQVAKPYLEEHEFDQLLFSYHGIPERHVKKSDPSSCYCLEYEDCCEREHPAHAFCYRHQTFATSKAFARRANLSPEDYTIAFQSRLGRDPWLKPYTDHELEKMPSRQMKRIAVICPAFVSDCLETLEEIGMRGREDFIKAGGKEFVYIPCLNDHPRWIDVLEKFARRFVATRELVAEDAERAS